MPSSETQNHLRSDSDHLVDLQGRLDSEEHLDNLDLVQVAKVPAVPSGKSVAVEQASALETLVVPVGAEVSVKV